MWNCCGRKVRVIEENTSVDCVLGEGTSANTTPGVKVQMPRQKGCWSRFKRRFRKKSKGHIKQRSPVVKYKSFVLKDYWWQAGTGNNQANTTTDNDELEDLGELDPENVTWFINEMADHVNTNEVWDGMVDMGVSWLITTMSEHGVFDIEIEFEPSQVVQDTADNQDANAEAQDLEDATEAEALVFYSDESSDDDISEGSTVNSDEPADYVTPEQSPVATTDEPSNADEPEEVAVAILEDAYTADEPEEPTVAILDEAAYTADEPEEVAMAILDEAAYTADEPEEPVVAILDEAAYTADEPEEPVVAILDEAAYTADRPEEPAVAIMEDACNVDEPEESAVAILDEAAYTADEPEELALAILDEVAYNADEAEEAVVAFLEEAYNADEAEEAMVAILEELSNADEPEQLTDADEPKQTVATSGKRLRSAKSERPFVATPKKPAAVTQSDKVIQERSVSKEVSDRRASTPGTSDDRRIKVAPARGDILRKTTLATTDETSATSQSENPSVATSGELLNADKSEKLAATTSNKSSNASKLENEAVTTSGKFSNSSEAKVEPDVPNDEVETEKTTRERLGGRCRKDDTREADDDTSAKKPHTRHAPEQPKSRTSARRASSVGYKVDGTEGDSGQGQGRERRSSSISRSGKISDNVRDSMILVSPLSISSVTGQHKSDSQTNQNDNETHVPANTASQSLLPSKQTNNQNQIVLTNHQATMSQRKFSTPYLRSQIQIPNPALPLKKFNGIVQKYGTPDHRLQIREQNQIFKERMKNVTTKVDCHRSWIMPNRNYTYSGLGQSSVDQDRELTPSRGRGSLRQKASSYDRNIPPASDVNAIKRHVPSLHYDNGGEIRDKRPQPSGRSEGSIMGKEMSVGQTTPTASNHSTISEGLCVDRKEAHTDLLSIDPNRGRKSPWQIHARSLDNLDLSPVGSFVFTTPLPPQLYERVPDITGILKSMPTANDMDSISSIPSQDLVINANDGLPLGLCKKPGLQKANSRVDTMQSKSRMLVIEPKDASTGLTRIEFSRRPSERFKSLKITVPNPTPPMRTRGHMDQRDAAACQVRRKPLVDPLKVTVPNPAPVSGTRGPRDQREAASEPTRKAFIPPTRRSPITYAGQAKRARAKTVGIQTPGKVEKWPPCKWCGGPIESGNKANKPKKPPWTKAPGTSVEEGQRSHVAATSYQPSSDAGCTSLMCRRYRLSNVTDRDRRDPDEDKPKVNRRNQGRRYQDM